ncbi:hypothetical protein [Chengkuizengella sediminis]|uniref:hypothetical protein n=1 Tax=Chengkuizengella sediminis TaxID=1885917 RepID=UPI001389A13E|nr:hypothetical protein [Chengkuizengella sediminis]NDI35780.1 hypothetical protein [Chengkuizengella sediminis]
MKILIGQPKRENSLEQLENEVENNPTVDIVLFPEGYFHQDNMQNVCNLAKTYNTIIVTGYKDDNNKDRVSIINSLGELVLERAKTPEDEKLYTPSNIEENGVNLGYLLCVEIFKGLEGLVKHDDIDIIFNPIGVGMFSEAQFEEWTNEARKIAIDQRAMIIGASHADGSYRNCGFSIPISYCFDKNGQEILISKNDVRTRILDTTRKSVEVIENSLI